MVEVLVNKTEWKLGTHYSNTRMSTIPRLPMTAEALGGLSRLELQHFCKGINSEASSNPVICMLSYLSTKMKNYKRLAFLRCIKWETHCLAIIWLRCHLTFLLIATLQTRCSLPSRSLCVSVWQNQLIWLSREALLNLETPNKIGWFNHRFCLGACACINLFSRVCTVETVVLGHSFFFSTSMFGIGFWRNGKWYQKSDCRVMLVNYMTTHIESVKLSHDFVVIQHFRFCKLFRF